MRGRKESSAVPWTVNGLPTSLYVNVCNRACCRRSTIREMPARDCERANRSVEKNGLQTVDAYTFNIALKLFVPISLDAFGKAPTKVGYDPGLSPL